MIPIAASSTIAARAPSSASSIAGRDFRFFFSRRRDVAVVLSPEEFRRLSKAASGKVNPAVQKLHAESAKRWSKVYEALAK
jgi:hypothetical protein